MTEFPGFPTNDFDFHFEEAGGALAGLLMRSRSGDVIPGVLPNSERILSPGDGWTIRVKPFVACRSKARSVLIGGTTDELVLDVDPAPSANSRIDVIYSLPADVSAGDPVRAAAVSRGLPGAVPAKPSIPDGAIELGTFRVAAGQTGAASAKLEETFRFAALTGGLLYARNLTELSQVDAISGTRAFILTGGATAERVGTKWLASTTAAYLAPFRYYVETFPAMSLEVSDGMVHLEGAATSTRPAELTSVLARVMGRIPIDYAPRRERTVVMQGSGAGRWALSVTPSGDVTASRYGPDAPAASVWLPFSMSWPLKRG